MSRRGPRHCAMGLKWPRWDPDGRDGTRPGRPRRGRSRPGEDPTTGRGEPGQRDTAPGWMRGCEGTQEATGGDGGLTCQLSLRSFTCCCSSVRDLTASASRSASACSSSCSRTTLSSSGRRLFLCRARGCQWGRGIPRDGGPPPWMGDPQGWRTPPWMGDPQGWRMGDPHGRGIPRDGGPPPMDGGSPGTEDPPHGRGTPRKEDPPHGQGIPRDRGCCPTGTPGGRLRCGVII